MEEARMCGMVTRGSVAERDWVRCGREEEWGGSGSMVRRSFIGVERVYWLWYRRIDSRIGGE